MRHAEEIPNGLPDIAALVDKILAAKKSRCEGGQKWEAEIDALVAQLYGLTPEEIAIVEEKA